MARDENLSKSASVPPSMVSAAQFLIDRINYERTNDIPYGKREFKLERMGRLLGRLGDPQNDVRVIHVAGSKGKGSTSTIIASILTEAGLRTGLYTSPHLLRLEERFRIDGEEITSQQLSRLVQTTIQPVVASLDEEAIANGQPWDTPTFFEITTAAAMVYFREQKVEAAVLEVGLGGRLDSTNICRPECCVITSISLDHTKQLGSTHSEIASEKAGILKTGVPLVTGVTHPEALTTISTAAESLACPQWTIQKDFRYTSKTANSQPPLPMMDFVLHEANRSQSDACNLHKLAALKLDDLQLGMWGEHQAANAAVAVMVAHVLRSKDKHGWQIPDEAIRNGLCKAVCQARIELVSENPPVIVDTAHNLASMQALIDTLDQRFDLSPAQRIVVFATSKGKQHAEMLKLLQEWAGRLVLTKYQENPRGVPVEQLEKQLRASSAPKGAEVFTAKDPKEALDLAFELNDNESLICVTGSFFLAAEALAILK